MKTQPRSTKSRGFTLVELLTVVAILGIVLGFAATYMRPNQSERCKSAARTLLGIAQEARQTAVSTRQSVRIALATSSGAHSIVVETRDPTTTTQWNPVGGALRLTNGVQVCSAASSTVISGTSSPTCPIASNQYVCFSPSGAVNVVGSGTDCNDNASTGGGATLYLRTFDGKDRFKLMIWGLTGLARLVDTW